MAERTLGKHFIRQWREYRGYSLRKLAAMMEREPGEQLTSHANLGRIETFEQPYTQEILEALSVALKADVVSLLTVDPNKDGEVVDLVRLITAKNRPMAVRMLKVLTGEDGPVPMLPIGDEPDVPRAKAGKAERKGRRKAT
jgi:transcriptional regulator with XRE-family HTH domain